MKGVTRIAARPPPVSDFNPHTREGCDSDAPTGIQNIRLISIHTPVKGVTATGGAGSVRSTNFNPHTREGCDGIPGPLCRRRSPHFNPHTREGCDIMTETVNGTKIISIHTPVKGVTAALPRSGRYRTDFNPHTREGCDPRAIPEDLRREISIHTPVKGVT